MKKHQKNTLFYLSCILLVFALGSRPVLPARGQETARIDSLFQAGVEAFEKKRFQEAQTLFRHVIEQDSLYQNTAGTSAWTFRGLALEASGQKDEAVETLSRGRQFFEESDTPDLAWHYHYPRILAETGHSDRLSTITRDFYILLTHISPLHHAALWEVLWDQTRNLLFREEREALEKRMENMESPGVYLKNAFRRNDPTPATTPNEFLLSFFQRAAHARKKYSSATSPRGYDDRGDVYVRLGPPYKIIYDLSGVVGPVGYAIHPYEFWLYKNIHPDIYFTFVGRTGNVDLKRAEGPESVFGTFYNRRKVFFGRNQRGETALSLRYHIYQLLASLHNNFQKRLTMMNLYPVDEALEYAKHHFPREDRAHNARVEALIDSLVLGQNFNLDRIPMRLTMLNFKGPGDQNRLEFYYSVALKLLEFEFTNATYMTMLRNQIGLFNNAYTFIAGDTLAQTFVLKEQDPIATQEFISQYTFSLDPGQYHLTFRVDNPQGSKESLYRVSFRTDPFPETLCISDIQLSLEIYPTEATNRFTKNGLYIRPFLGESLPVQRPFFAYFEVYHLTQDEEGKALYEVSYTVHRIEEKRGFLGLSSSKKRTAQIAHDHFTGHSSKTSAHDFFQLILDQAQPGEYEITITVTDTISKARVEKTVPLFLTG